MKIPDDLQELYDTAAALRGTGMWMPDACERVCELIERVASLTHTTKARWSVYLERSNAHGPLPPLRMICANEAEARRQYAKPRAVAIGKEELEEREQAHE